MDRGSVFLRFWTYRKKSVPKIFAALAGGNFVTNNYEINILEVLPLVCPPHDSLFEWKSTVLRGNPRPIFRITYRNFLFFYGMCFFLRSRTVTKSLLLRYVPIKNNAGYHVFSIFLSFFWDFSKKLFFHRFWSSENHRKIDFFDKMKRKTHFFQMIRKMFFVCPWRYCVRIFRTQLSNWAFQTRDQLFRFSHKEIPLEILEAGILTEGYEQCGKFLHWQK